MARERLRLTRPHRLTRFAFGVSSHSGGGSDVITRGGQIFVVWGESRPVSSRLCGAPASTLGVGSPTYVAQLRRRGDQLDTVARARVPARSLPANDAHNWPAIAAGRDGTLHLIVGAHNCPFFHLRSRRPLDVRSWSSPTPTLPEDPRGICKRRRQTYAGFMRGRDGWFHLAFRFRTGQGLVLAHQSLPPGADRWSEPTTLVAPPPDVPTKRYAAYYHKLTVDRRGRLYLLFGYAPHIGPASAWFRRNQRYKYGTLWYSDDQGNGWDFATPHSLSRGVFGR